MRIRFPGPVGFSPFADDHRHTGQGFDVVNAGGATVETLNRREWRLGSGHAPLAFNTGDEGGFFPAHKGSGAFHDVQGEPAPGAEEIRTQQTGFGGVFHGAAHALNRQGIFGANVDKPLLGIDGVGSDEHAFDHGVGVALHYRAVHERTGVALVTVTDDVLDIGGIRQG